MGKCVTQLVLPAASETTKLGQYLPGAILFSHLTNLSCQRQFTNAFLQLLGLMPLIFSHNRLTPHVVFLSFGFGSPKVLLKLLNKATSNIFLNKPPYI